MGKYGIVCATWDRKLDYSCSRKEKDMKALSVVAICLLLSLSNPASSTSQSPTAPTWTAEGVVTLVNILESDSFDTPTSVEIILSVGPYGRKLPTHLLSLAAIGSTADAAVNSHKIKVGSYIWASGPIEQVRAPHSSSLVYLRLRIESLGVLAAPH